MGQPALQWCSAVTALSLPAFCNGERGAALEEGSPEINLFSPQAGDQERGAVRLLFQASLHLI